MAIAVAMAVAVGCCSCLFSRMGARCSIDCSNSSGCSGGGSTDCSGGPITFPRVGRWVTRARPFHYSCCRHISRYSRLLLLCVINGWYLGRPAYL